MIRKESSRLDAILNQVDDTVGELMGKTDFAELLKDAKNLPPELAEEIRRYAGGEEDPEVQKALDAVSHKAQLLVTIEAEERAARLEVIPATGLAGRPQEGDVWKALSDAGVRSGIISDRLADVIARAMRGEAVRAPRMAFGFPPFRGADGYCDFQKNPAEDYAGDAVEPGDLVGLVIPPRPGKDGHGVTEKPIPAEPGKAFEIRLSEGLVLDPATGEIRAEKCGMLRRADETGKPLRLFIDEVRRIEGNLDAILGDIHFPGSLIIEGDILRGRVVEARMGIEVKGTIEGAIVRSAEGSIRVGKGIQSGGEGMVSAGGSLSAKFIENATIYSQGDIEAQVSILHSNLTAGGRVIVKGKRGAVVGGTIRAYDGLEAREIGAIGTRTKIFFGLSLDAIRDLEAIDLRLRRVIEVRTRIRQAIASLLKDKPPEDLSPEGKKTFADLKRKDLLLALDERKTVAAKRDILDRATTERRGELICHDRLHAGVRIRFGDILYDVNAPMENCRLHLGEHGVTIGPAR